jgi:hypothetical protein
MECQAAPNFLLPMYHARGHFYMGSNNLSIPFALANGMEITGCHLCPAWDKTSHQKNDFERGSYDHATKIAHKRLEKNYT